MDPKAEASSLCLGYEIGFSRGYIPLARYSVAVEVSSISLSNATFTDVTSTLIRDYMINYARSFIYTTSISYANIIAVDSSFDLLERGALEPVSPFQNTSIIVAHHI